MRYGFRASVLTAVVFFCGFLPASGAFAQSVPPVNAGSLEQQINREREVVLPRHGSGEGLIQERVHVSGETSKIQVTISQFNFEGNNLLSDEVLSEAVAAYVNRPIGFTDLQAAAAAVGEAYRARGFVVRAYLPEQDIVNGTVTIKIVEGKFGQARIEGGADTWFTPQKLEAMIAARQASGQPVDAAQLDRALLLADDLPGVSVSGRLQPGAREEETDLAVNLAGEPWLSGGTILDNEGARATGAVRAHAFMRAGSPLRMGDETSLYALAAEGMQFARLEETLPVGTNGWRVGVNASALNYRVLPSEFDALEGKGSLASLGLQASYPIIRARQKNLFVDFNVDHKLFKNKTQGDTSSRYSTDSATTALRGNFSDMLGGGGNTSAEGAFTLGSLDLGALNTGEDPQLDDSYRKFNFSVTRLQNIMPSVSLFASVSGQLSPEKKIDSSEMFYLGGPLGVRAYPVSEASGSSGVLVTIEPRWQIASGYNLSAFYDHGYVHNRDGTKNYSLKGAGVSFAWNTDIGLNLKTTWAHRLGDNPNPAADGDDQDGSMMKNRFWLQASMQF